MEVDVAATVECEPDFSLDGTGGTLAIGGDIETAITRYVEAVEPGDEIVLAQVAGRIALVTGVHDVAAVELNGATANIPVPSEPAEIPAIGTITLTEGDV
jgi:uncharacterized phage protein gp47/JayE